MRAESSAICTWGEPVSPSGWRNFSMISVLMDVCSEMLCVPYSKTGAEYLRLWTGVNHPLMC